MLFFEPVYILLFFPITLFLFYTNKKFNIDFKYILIFLSLFFYSWWNFYYTPLIIFSILTNYFFSKLILNNNININRKYILFCSIGFNVLLLIIFKYSDFFILNINFFFNTNIKLTNFPFPLAISFLTFQTITFLINCYDKEIKNFNLKNFFLFIIFFPQLIAGPIVKFNEIIYQYKDKKLTQFKFENFNIGLIIFLIGFAKKVILADTLGLYVDQASDNYTQLEFLSSWLLSLSFTFQFYFDFSGYVDMATGSALMLNIFLPKNFNSPFKSLSIINFWQRWHITLTNFLTNYFYLPMIMSFKKINFFNSMFFLLIVFLIAGLWHGPSWNFVLFGLFHGFGLIINHIYKKYINYEINSFIKWFLTFNFINISFVFFRFKDFEIIKTILLNLINFKELNYQKNFFLEQYIDIKFLIIFILSVVVCFCFSNTYSLIEKIKK